MRGEASAIPSVIGSTLLRGALAGVGIYVAGARGKDLAKYTVAATLAIELGVLIWAAHQAQNQR